MDLPDLKALKRLAKTCREAGIHTFKGAGIEFTLTHEAPPSPRRQKRSQEPVNAANSPSTAFQSDTLPEEALLFWSTDNTPAPEEGTDT